MLISVYAVDLIINRTQFFTRQNSKISDCTTTDSTAQLNLMQYPASYYGIVVMSGAYFGFIPLFHLIVLSIYNYDRLTCFTIRIYLILGVENPDVSIDDRGNKPGIKSGI